MKKKNIDFNDTDGENERHIKRSSFMRESESWIEVQPKRKTKPLGSKTSFNPNKGHYNLGQNFAQDDSFKGKKMNNLGVIKVFATEVLGNILF